MAKNPINKALAISVTGYQIILSPFLSALGGPSYGCRFSISCSQYAKQMLLTESLHTAIYMSLKRLLRCHPYG